MASKKNINRREFLRSTSAAAIGAAGLRGEKIQEGKEPEIFRSPSGSMIPFSRKQLLPPDSEQRVFTGAQLTEIAFPLGGIGTGTVSLGGRGQLRDWEIFNRPGKGRVLPFSFVALWLREDGETGGTVRVLEAQSLPPYRGSLGSPRESAEGLPRLKSARFTGTYPIAKIEFDDNSLPLKISLETFNPFVPLNVDDSSLPVAIFQYQLKSTGQKPVDAALAFSLLNVVGYDGKTQLEGNGHPGFGRNLTEFRSEETDSGLPIRGLHMTSGKYGPEDLGYGSMALMTTEPQVSVRTAWEGGNWWDPFQKWVDEFGRNGEFHNSQSAGPSAEGTSNFATLAPRARLQPGETKTITFLLSWYFPVRENYWNDEKEVNGSRLRNYYGTRFESAWQVGRHTAERLLELERATRSFQEAFFSSTVPAYVLETVSSQAAIIRTNTCMLLEGKQFFAFEGCDDYAGSCPMNCTHVWNYEQALAFLYPELERSMRHTDFLFNMRDDHSMTFRTLVPVGRAQWKHSPAADGQMGCLMKLYREWQISGDIEFLKSLWPRAKNALEYAWTGWDANKDGLMEGQQHNTYDIEFYGPNSMMSTLYLGALRAGELMAAAVGDSESASSYKQVRENGVKNLEQLWNGEYYVQKIPAASAIVPLEKYAPASWYADAVQDGQIKYQFGDGCLSDQLLGVWMATVAGLDVGWSSERIRSSLRSIYRYNFKHSFDDHPNTQRIFALNDEKGLLLCSWPKGGRPALPFVYSDEVWTGIEYQVAAHLIYEGLLEEGLAIVRGIWERYDGERRNPWNEIECGAHYARAMASWSVLLALSGYHYSAPERSLSFDPQVNPHDFKCFFAAGRGWGTFSQRLTNSGMDVQLRIDSGELRLRYLNLANKFAAASLSTTAVVGPAGKALVECKSTPNQNGLQVNIGPEIVLAAGQTLSLRLSALPQKPIVG